MNKNKLAAALVFAFGSFQALAAETADKITIAELFLTALETGDVETAAQYVHDEIWFEDPTWGSEIHGRAEVLKAYEGYTGGVKDISRHRTKGYESNGTVVLEYIFHVQMDVVGDDKPSSYMPMMGEGLRIIGFKDGKIVRHSDLSDYTTIRQKLAEAAAKK